jgi:hypothetical protein
MAARDGRTVPTAITLLGVTRDMIVLIVTNFASSTV